MTRVVVRLVCDPREVILRCCSTPPPVDEVDEMTVDEVEWTDAPEVEEDDWIS